MQIVKSLIGGILGSAIGLGLYYALTTGLKKPLPWGVVIIGILAGVGVRLFCGKNRNLITGLVATATALIALLGYNFATISAAELSAPPISSLQPEEYPPWVDEAEISPEDEAAMNEDQDESDEDDSDEEAPRDEDENEQADDATPDESSSSDPVASDESSSAPEERTTDEDAPTQGPVLPKPPSSQTDMIALGLSGLLAYFIGRGSGIQTTTQSTDPAPNN